VKVLLWKLMIIVPIGAIICYWIVSYLPGLQQMEAEQRTAARNEFSRLKSRARKIVRCRGAGHRPETRCTVSRRPRPPR